MTLRYLSLCSGIEAATVAWEPLGWTAAAYAEIEKFPSAVLAHHYPSVPNLGDITQISGKDFRGKIDLIVGGTPCQSYSTAGLRGGLDDPRGQLTLVFFEIVGKARPRWVVWENVPGVLSIDQGRTFGTILGQMAKLGYGFAYKIYDAQHFGVPQRRRRVYLVGHLGNWRLAAAVLFERHSLSGDTPAGRSQRTKSAGSVAAGPGSHGRPAIAPSMCAGAPFARTGNSRVECEALVTQALTARLGDGGPDDNKAQGGFYIPSVQAFGGNKTFGPIRVSPALNAHGGGSRRLDFESETVVANTLRGEGFDGSEDGTGRANLIPVPINLQLATRYEALGDRTAFGIGPEGGPAFTLTKTHSHGVFTGTQGLSLRGRGAELSGDISAALRAAQGGSSKAHVLSNLAVRRLTTLECERLQGFPDNYTLIPWRGKPAELCPDGPRYKALGNSMAVPVMRWLGERIMWVENIMADQAA